MNFILYVECYLIHSLSCFAFRKTLNSFSASKAGSTKVTGFSIFHLAWASVTYKLLILSLSYTTTLSRAGCRQHCCYHRERQRQISTTYICGCQAEGRDLKPGQVPSNLWTICQHQLPASPHSTDWFSIQLSESLVKLAIFLPNYA